MLGRQALTVKRCSQIDNKMIHHKGTDGPALRCYRYRAGTKTAVNETSVPVRVEDGENAFRAVSGLFGDDRPACDRVVDFEAHLANVALDWTNVKFI